MKSLKSFCRGLARGLLGAVIWPISTCFSARRMWKIFRDPDTSLFFPREQTRHISVARYKMPFSYISVQTFTLVGNLMFIVFEAVMFPQQQWNTITEPVIFLASFHLTTISVINAISCLCNKDIFNAAIDVIITPIKACSVRNPKFLTQNIILQSALLTNNTTTINQIIENNGRSALNLELSSHFPKQITTLQEMLFQNTPLPAEVTHLITEYCFHPYYLSLTARNISKTHHILALSINDISLDVKSEDSESDRKLLENTSISSLGLPSLI